MNPKSVIQFTMIMFLIIILYLLGTRININVGNIREIQVEAPIFAPTETFSPSPTFYEEKGLDGPYGKLSNNMIKNMDQYPHKNPMMYKKRERVFLDNINE